MAARERLIAEGKDLVDRGEGVRFTVDSAGRALPAFVIRYRGAIYGYLNVCADQELELDWIPGTFFDADTTRLVCSAHGALYEPDSGRCMAGSCAGASPVRLPVRELEDGAIVMEGDED